MPRFQQRSEKYYEILLLRTAIAYGQEFPHAQNNKQLE